MIKINTSTIMQATQDSCLKEYNIKNKNKNKKNIIQNCYWRTLKLCFSITGDLYGFFRRSFFILSFLLCDKQRENTAEKNQEQIIVISHLHLLSNIRN